MAPKYPLNAIIHLTDHLAHCVNGHLLVHWHEQRLEYAAQTHSEHATMVSASDELRLWHTHNAMYEHTASNYTEKSSSAATPCFSYHTPVIGPRTLSMKTVALWRLKEISDNLPPISGD